LEAYDQYWDFVRTEKGLYDTAQYEGLTKGLIKGLIKGKAEGLAEGRMEELERIVLTAYQNKLSIEQIQAFSNLHEDEIREILKKTKN
jgi:predicted transposase YdaD